MTTSKRVTESDLLLTQKKILDSGMALKNKTMEKPSLFLKSVNQTIKKHPGMACILLFSSLGCAYILYNRTHTLTNHNIEDKLPEKTGDNHFFARELSRNIFSILFTQAISLLFTTLQQYIIDSIYARKKGRK